MGDGADAKKPAANISLMSIGRLGLEENKKHSGTPVFSISGQLILSHSLSFNYKWEGN